MVWGRRRAGRRREVGIVRGSGRRWRVGGAEPGDWRVRAKWLGGEASMSHGQPPALAGVSGEW